MSRTLTWKMTPLVDDTKFYVELPELRMYRLLDVSNNLESVFPNTVIAFCTYLRLSMMVSNCSGERSFSKLKFLKSHL